VPPEPAVQPIPAGYTPVAGLLKDRVILITGAGDGLGRAAALACAGLGATVVLLGRTVKKLEAVYDAIEASGGPQPAIYPMNLLSATWNEHGQLAETLEREFGKLHGIVHCAAHFTSFAPLETLPPKDWMDSLQVNLTAAYTLTRLCLPLLDRAGDASVVFLSEAAAHAPKAFRGAYGLTKIALEGLMRMWAQELETRPQIRINTYDPGPLRTELRRRGYPSGHDRVPLPETAVPGLLWLLGPASKGQSGKAFVNHPGTETGQS
jgi:NAD(P)-dependent dehydrogenase (short-subunit alcohol dehydrogenase family)